MDKSYNMYNVLLGMFSNFPEEVKGYNYNEISFNNFFFNRRNDYKILDHVAFDNDGLFPASKELSSAYEGVRMSLIQANMDFKKNYLRKNAIAITFKNYSKEKFNSKELKELEKLGEEFREEFC